MAEVAPTVHPYIPNTAPESRAAMLRYLGIADEEELYVGIPERLRFRGKLDLPPPLSSEYALDRHLRNVLDRNTSCAEALNFRGGGCWQHYVPAVCDEIATRGEFLTTYVGSPQSNRGIFQAQFEYQSMIGELVGLDAVGAPTYDWGAAAASALLMACRVTGREEVVIPAILSPERAMQIHAICGRAATIHVAAYDPVTGGLDLSGLTAKISDRTAAVYLEVPSYLGIVDGAALQAAEAIHSHGGLLVVGADPSSLGVLAAPAAYGADIVCGDLQPLGIHMNCSGGLAGFIATRHEERYLAEHPTLLVGIVPTVDEGDRTFAWVNFETTHYVRRSESKDFTGTTQLLWGVVAATYLALLGPRGIQELGESILYRTEYAIGRLGAIKGVTVPFARSGHFKEFVLRFDGTGHTVAAINSALRDQGIFGGKDLSREVPALGQSALYCVTEIHTLDDIERLARALEGAVA